MALIPIIKVCQTCSSLTIKDVTGFYDADLNPTGWGGPNLERDFTGTAVLEIKFGTTVLQYDVKETIQEAVFPEYVLYEYAPSTLDDGVYTITLTLIDTDNNVTYKASKKITSECIVTCCVDKLALKVAESCNCDSLAYDNFSQASLLLETLPLIAVNLGEKAYNTNLKKLQKICKTTDCGCGCS